MAQNNRKVFCFSYCYNHRLFLCVLLVFLVKQLAVFSGISDVRRIHRSILYFSGAE